MSSSTDSNSENEARTNRFLQLYSLQQSRFYAYIITVVPNVADADDIFQETTTELWRKFDQFEPDTNFVAWGMTIARYKIMEYHRRKNKPVLFNDETINALECKVRGLFEKDDYRIDSLKKCLQKLGQRDRWLILLRYQEELPVKLISERIGRNFKSVYRTLARIHDNLRWCIGNSMAREESYDA